MGDGQGLSCTPEQRATPPRRWCCRSVLAMKLMPRPNLRLVWCEDTEHEEHARIFSVVGNRASMPELKTINLNHVLTR